MEDRLLFFDPPAAIDAPSKQPLLRAHAPGEVLLFAVWSRLQPMPEEYDPKAFSRLRERLMRLIARGVEPVVCLYRAGDAPAWFTDQGGWEREDNLWCYLR